MIDATKMLCIRDFATCLIRDCGWHYRGPEARKKAEEHQEQHTKTEEE
jgi:hypothetical protein